jgi:peptide/nickel transport system substrate-binding protein
MTLPPFIAQHTTYIKTMAVIVTVIFISALTACNAETNPKTVVEENVVTITSTPDVPGKTPPKPSQTPSATPKPTRLLTVCLGSEPASLFLYGDSSSAAQSIRQAIYDGPVDWQNYEAQPVILQKIPAIADGDVLLQPIEVAPGELILDADRNWVALQVGGRYFPSGCSEQDCAKEFEGTEPVMMDEMRIHFSMLPEILWSDGTPLTAVDSVYSFDVFKEIFANTGIEILRFTKTYQALDENTVEWVGIPGYQGAYVTKFFSPLPHHRWQNFSPAELFTAEISTQTPMGWGPYIIDEWVAGDHITLSRNPNYFRAGDGLPIFDHLVFRFVPSGSAAVDAVVVNECDFVDRSALLESQVPRLQAEHDAGKLNYEFQMGTSWELLAFGIDTLSLRRYDLFESAALRQGIALCIDRQAIVDQLFYGVPYVPDTFVPSGHPLVNSEINSYQFNPEEAAQRFALAGWVDFDLNPDTPLTASGIPYIPNGTPFKVHYFVPNDAERPEVAEMIAADLRECGLGVEVISEEWQYLFSPGPDGPVFGRQFDMVQFAWSTNLKPTCSVFSTAEVPGLEPGSTRGWGGANVSGYRNPEFDAFCRQSQYAFPESPVYQDAMQQMQEIFAEDLPVLPLFPRIRLIAYRPDMCGVQVDPVASTALTHLESFDYGENCQK